ncbi:MAG TPA: DMT family transporter [Acidimicrobiales bacterium]|jgi:drug/metabolite transporter (DMT)-like permease
MVVLTALASALAYAVAMVLQQRGAQRTDPAASLRPGLLVQLAAQSWWLVGIAANVVAFGLRALALARGSLVLVQPLLLTGLFFALVIETRLAGRRLTQNDTWASVGLISGLSLFAIAASPTTGHSAATPLAWIAVAVVAGLPVGLAIAQASARTSGDARAAWLAGAAGLLLAALAALTKQATAQLGSQGLAVFAHWTPWAAGAVGVTAVVVAQSAFQAAPLRSSLPVLSVVEPLASIAIGALAFHERIDTSPSALVTQMIGLALLVAGVIVLTTRSELTSPTPAPATTSPAATRPQSTARRATA